MSRSGADLALLLLAGFQSLVSETQELLAQHGHPDHRSVHHFALRAIAHGAKTTTELGQRLDVTRQAAAKTVATLELRGYVERRADPDDARRKRLAVTDLGRELLEQGEASMQLLRDRWAASIGVRELDALQDALTELVGAPAPDDAARWMLRDLG